MASSGQAGYFLGGTESSPALRLNPTRVILVVLVVLPLAFGLGYTAGRSQSDPPVAVVNGEVLRTSHLEKELSSRFGRSIQMDGSCTSDR